MATEHTYQPKRRLLIIRESSRPGPGVPGDGHAHGLGGGEVDVQLKFLLGFHRSGRRIGPAENARGHGPGLAAVLIVIETQRGLTAPRGTESTSAAYKGNLLSGQTLARIRVLLVERIRSKGKKGIKISIIDIRYPEKGQEILVIPMSCSHPFIFSKSLLFGYS